MSRDSKLSVVIPSLGGDLGLALNALNSGSIIPDEIIICLPNSSHSVDNLDLYLNVTVIYCYKYGQVYQRICGFRRAKNSYVLQLDDDVIVDHDCISRLLCYMHTQDDNVALSPYWIKTGSHEDFCPGKKSAPYMSLYYWLLNSSDGYVPGGVSLAGTEFCVNKKDLPDGSKHIGVEWQSGGCVLHARKNLITKNYYPFPGKAYSEDLFHSYLLRQKGVNLRAVLTAIAFVDENLGISIGSELLPSFRARLHYVKLTQSSVLRMLIYFFVYVSKSSVMRLLNFTLKE